MTRSIGICIATCVSVATFEASALDLTRDGEPASTIVLPQNATQLEREGAETLVKYFEMACGAKIPIVAEPAGPSGVIISIGKTEMAARAGITDAGLRYDGYRLVVRDNTLYLLGRDTKLITERRRRTGAQGSIRAALGLLEKLGFRWLQPTPMGVHVPQVATVSVPDGLDFTHEPIFMYVAGRMYNWGDWSLANSFRKAGLIYSAGGHTWCLAVPNSLWPERKDCFRMQNGKRIQPVGGNYQLCPSNPEVIRRIGEWLIGTFDEGYELVALGQPDGYQACECERCRALDKPGECHEQCHYAQYKAIEMAYKKHPDRLVHLLIYGPTLRASSRFAKYPPNAMTEVCLTGGCAMIYGSHEQALDFWKERIPGGATVYVYYMGMYHNVALGPKFTPRAAAEKILMLHEHGVKGIYFCGGGENWGAEGPTYYVIGRLVTDPSQDWRQLLKEYCDLTFRDAGATIRQYYDLLYKRLDRYHPRGAGKDGADAFTAAYTPEVIEQLGSVLRLAENQAAGDTRALSWIRLVKISYSHFSLIAKALHVYQAYQLNPTINNLEQARDAVRAYHAFADEMLSLRKTDPKFVKNYLPGAGYWIGKSRKWGSIKTNLKTLKSPFTWDFDALLEAGVLPGKTRAKTVFTRLSAAPEIDGEPVEKAWNDAPWVEVPEASMGQAEASTRMRLGYDDQTLYFAFECNEPLIDEMKVVEYARDGKVYNTDCVEIFLAPDGVGQKRIQIVVSPTKEGKWDGRYGYIDDPLHPLVLSGKADTSWNPEFRHAYKIDKAGKKWTIEIAIPFAELGEDTPAEGARWRGNFGRERHKRVWKPKEYYGQAEFFLWSPNLQKVAFTDPSAFGDVHFGRMPEDGWQDH